MLHITSRVCASYDTNITITIRPHLIVVYMHLPWKYDAGWWLKREERSRSGRFFRFLLVADLTPSHLMLLLRVQLFWMICSVVYVSSSNCLAYYYRTLPDRKDDTRRKAVCGSEPCCTTHHEQRDTVSSLIERSSAFWDRLVFPISIVRACLFANRANRNDSSRRWGSYVCGSQATTYKENNISPPSS